MNNNNEFINALNLSFEEEQTRQMNILEINNITENQKNNIHDFCHWDYNKMFGTCGICTNKTYLHKCLLCKYFTCKKCLLNIMKNNNNNNCAYCRNKINYNELVSKNHENINYIKLKYGNNYTNLIANSEININRNNINLTGIYYYRNSKLHIQFNKPPINENTSIYIDFQQYNINSQFKIIDKLLLNINNNKNIEYIINNINTINPNELLSFLNTI